MNILPPNNITLANLPTPFRLLQADASSYPRIWIKEDDQSSLSLSGNKVRKLEYLLAEAKEYGADTVITCGGMQSNHCRATALACARIGLKCILLLRADDENLAISNEGNAFLGQLAGAELRVFRQSHYQKSLNTLVKNLEKELIDLGRKSYFIPTGGSNAMGMWGYIQAAKELAEDFQRNEVEPEYVVCASGSAGTQAGLSLGFHLLNMKTKVLGVAVCDSNEYFIKKIRRDVGDWCDRFATDAIDKQSLLDSLELHVVDDYIGPGYAKVYPEILALIKSFARNSGLILDPVYTAKAYYGLLQECQNGVLKSTKNVVFLHTGGAFGLFPWANKLIGLNT
jgi:D-cysteine desulfhydrase